MVWFLNQIINCVEKASKPDLPVGDVHAYVDLCYLVIESLMQNCLLLLVANRAN